MQYMHPSREYTDKVCSIIKAQTRLDPYQGSFVLHGALPKQVFNQLVPVKSLSWLPINLLYKQSIDSHINQQSVLS